MTIEHARVRLRGGRGRGGGGGGGGGRFSDRYGRGSQNSRRYQSFHITLSLLVTVHMLYNGKWV